MAVQFQYAVRFKNFNFKATVPLDYIRINKDQALQNWKKRQQMAEGQKAGDDEVGEF